MELCIIAAVKLMPDTVQEYCNIQNWFQWNALSFTARRTANVIGSHKTVISI